MSTPTVTTYADWLRGKLDERGWSQRDLARRLNPDNPEVARRAVRRYLATTVPIDRSRKVISDALGTDDLGPDSDSEDD